MERQPIIARVHEGALPEKALDALHVTAGWGGNRPTIEIFGERAVDEPIEKLRERIGALAPGVDFELEDQTGRSLIFIA